MSYKDFLGKPLEVGDKVLVLRGNGRYAASLERCTVVGFTPRKVRILSKPCQYSPEGTRSLADAPYCVKIDW